MEAAGWGKRLLSLELVHRDLVGWRNLRDIVSVMHVYGALWYGDIIQAK